MLVLVVLLLASTNAFGKVISIKEGDNIIVKISANDPNLIKIKNGRIKSVFGAEGRLKIKEDKKRGQVYVTPYQQYSRVITPLFIVDERGETHRLLLQPESIPAESVIIDRQDVGGVSEKAERWEQSQPYVAAIKNLIRLMAVGKEPAGYSKAETTEEVPLWKEARLTLVATYSGQNMTGEHYILTNTDSKTMRIKEKELHKPGVLAISVETHELEPNESTNIFVVADGGQ